MTEERFTEDEKAEARKVWGDTMLCVRCRKTGNVDDAFGWRRMRPGDTTIRPQAWCLECRRTEARP
jgi:hypothetical protein